MNDHFVELQIEIEDDCLLNCIHCSSYELCKHGKRNYTINDLIDFISVIKGDILIHFTGGDPLLCKDLTEICRKILVLNPNIKIALYTTGNCYGLTPISIDMAKDMKQSGIVECYFSIYSEIPEEHDLWTRTIGSYSNTMKSIQNLKEVGIHIKSHVVLNKYNYKNIESIIHFCSSVGVEEVRILKLTPSGRAKKHWKTIGIPLNTQKELVYNLVRKKSCFPLKLSFSGYPELHPCRSNENADGCQAGTHLLYIDANGDVFPCACTKRNPLKYRICNIREISKFKNYLLLREEKANKNVCLNEIIEHS